MRLKEFLRDGGDINSRWNSMSIDARTNYIKQDLLRRGYTQNQTAAILGNLLQENANLKTNTQNTSSGALGIAQWLGSRKKSIISQGKHSTITGQLDFLDSEIKGNAWTNNVGGKKAFFSNNDPAQLTRIFRKDFERPGEAEANDKKRISNAFKILGLSNTYTQDNSNTAEEKNDSTVIPQVNIQPLTIQDTRQYFLDNRGSFQPISNEQFQELAKLQSEKESQEQNAKQAELRNQQIQQELLQKQAEKQQLLSMIPQAQYVGQTQFQKGGTVNLSAETDWLKNWYANRQIPDPQFNSDLNEDRELVIGQLDKTPGTEIVDFISPNITGQYNHNGQKILFTPDSTQADRLHELDHYATDQALYINTNDARVIQDNIKTKDASKGIYNEKYDYFSKPNEIKARIMILRKEMGLDPSKPVNKEEVDRFIRNYNGKESNIYDLMHMTESPENIYNILNWTANNKSNQVQQKIS